MVTSEKPDLISLSKVALHIFVPTLFTRYQHLSPSEMSYVYFGNCPIACLRNIKITRNSAFSLNLEWHWAKQSLGVYRVNGRLGRHCCLAPSLFSASNPAAFPTPAGNQAPIFPQPLPLPGFLSLILHLVTPFCFFSLKIGVSGPASQTGVHLHDLIVWLQPHGDTHYSVSCVCPLY